MKVRGRLTTTGGGRFGLYGTAFNNLLFGATCIVSPSLAAWDGDSASVSVSGITTDDTVVALPSVCFATYFTQAMTCPVTDGFRVSWRNNTASDVSGSNTVTWFYVVFAAS